jgi:U6 snRNA-associated Sm-like protein LSm7
VHIAAASDASRITDEYRTLGLIVCRGTNVTVICPDDGMQEIANPFLPSEEGEGGAPAEEGAT